MATGQRTGGSWDNWVGCAAASWLLTAITGAWAGKAGIAFLASLTRYLHVAAWELGLFSAAAHNAESENARKGGRYGHPAWKVSLCHCY